eukprot:1038970-Rhodomonas_salina.2
MSSRAIWAERGAFLRSDRTLQTLNNDTPHLVPISKARPRSRSPTLSKCHIYSRAPVATLTRIVCWQAIEAGLVGVNEGVISTATMPFGGAIPVCGVRDPERSTGPDGSSERGLTLRRAVHLLGAGVKESGLGREGSDIGIDEWRPCTLAPKPHRPSTQTRNTPDPTQTADPRP